MSALLATLDTSLGQTTLRGQYASSVSAVTLLGTLAAWTRLDVLFALGRTCSELNQARATMAAESVTVSASHVPALVVIDVAVQIIT